MSDADTAEILEALDVLVGTWTVETSFESAPAGTATITWDLDHHCLVWRVTIPVPEFPDSLSLISVSDDGKTCLQHYFDARGTVRIYKMTIGSGTWTLWRDEPDFSPLEFAQRFTATVSPGGETITGTWEFSTSDGGWRKDFDLFYRKVA